MVPALHYLFVLWLDWGAATGVWGEPVQVVQATESQRVSLSCSLKDMLASGSLELSWFGPSGEELLYVHVTSHHSNISLGNAWSLQTHYASREDDVWFTCSWNGISGKNHTFRNRTELTAIYTAAPFLLSSQQPHEIDKDYRISSVVTQEISWLKDFETWIVHMWQGGYGDPKNPQEEVKGNLSSEHKEWHPESFPCDVSISNNWTNGSLLWFQNDLWGKKTVLNITMWRSPSYWPWMRDNDISLLLPSVRPRDAGNYTCEVLNGTQSRYYWLEVTAKSEASWLNLGDRHWIIWALALGYMVVCFSFLFLFLRIRHGIRTRRQQKKLRGAVGRRFFQAQRNRAHASNGALVCSTVEDGTEPVDAFSYENVMPTAGSGAGQQLLRKGNILPSATKIEDEEDEEYECPDCETEIKDAGSLYVNNTEQGSKNLIQDSLAEDDNYENANEEMKQRDLNLCDRSLYENRREEMKSGSCTWDSVGTLYANNTQQGNKNLIQNPPDEDAENYENVEEVACVSPGAARLIAGLQLALSSNLDKQDGGSEASTGSQSYEEMNGNLSPTASKTLHLHPNTSNEEDADSYENMESPNSFNSRKEGNLDPREEGAAFGSTQQNLSIALGLDLRGGMLCLD